MDSKTKVMACVVAAGRSFAALATDMEHKAKTLTTVMIPEALDYPM